MDDASQPIVDRPRAVEVVGAGIDTLQLGYVFDVAPRWLRALDEAKARADRSENAGYDPRTGEPLAPDPEPLTIGGIGWTIRHHGAAAGPFLGFHEAYATWAVNPRARNGAPTLTIRVLSAALWRDGAHACVAFCDRLAGELAREGLDRRYVQQIHVAVDFQGWQPVMADIDRFVANGAPTRELYADDVDELRALEHPASAASDDEPDELLDEARAWYRWQFTGFRFGKSSVVVGLYLKSIEIDAKNKGWFRTIWAKAEGGMYDPDAPVWRVEVRAPREFLKELRDEGSVELDTVEQVLANAAPIFRTVLLERIRLALGDATRKSRCTTHPAWKALTETTAIDGVCDGGLVTRLEQDIITREALIPKIRGYVAKWAALGEEQSLDDAFLNAATEVRDLCEVREEPFDRLVKEKREARAEAQARTLSADVRARTTRRAREREYAALRTKSSERRLRPRWAPAEQLQFTWHRAAAQMSFQWSME